MLKELAALSCAALLSACATPVAKVPVVTQHEWSAARRMLAELRRRAPRKPFVQIVHVSMREPITGHVIQARGAIAIFPHHAMRLVLLGPGGATALDVWVTPDAWRFAVPALNLVRHSKLGESSSDAAAGFPIEFFRWWFLGPLDGRLLYTQKNDDPDPYGFRTLVLANGESTISLKEACEPKLCEFIAVRRDLRMRGFDSLVWFSRRGFAPGPGEKAKYKQGRRGFEVEIGVEEISPDAPDQTAFIDPDGKGGASL